MADVAAPAAADNGRASPLRADLERPPPADARPLRAPPRDATAPVSAPLGRQAEEPGAPARGQPERGAGGGEQERSPQRQRAPVAHERPGSRPGRDNAAGEPPGGQAEEGTSGEGKGDRGPERHRSGPRAEGRTSREGHAQERARPALQERQVVSGRAPRAEVCSASTCHRPHFCKQAKKKGLQGSIQTACLPAVHVLCFMSARALAGLHAQALLDRSLAAATRIHCM